MFQRLHLVVTHVPGVILDPFRVGLGETLDMTLVESVYVLELQDIYKYLCCARVGKK